MKNKFDFQPKLVSALKNYSKEKFMTDLMAGIIVGIVALPLAIAFGIASGVSPEKGLITAILGGFFVSLLGGCNVQIGGPTGAFIVIVYGIIQNFGIEGLAIATVVAGIILVIMGALKLGTVIKFIPYPIVVGFTSGIALTIFTTQMKDLFGLTMDKVPADFISKWIAYFEHFDTMNLWSLLIGLTSIVIIAITPKFSKKIPGSLIAIILMTVVVYVMRYHLGITGIETIGDRFTINASLPGPETINFNMETINLLLPSAFTIDCTRGRQYHRTCLRRYSRYRCDCPYHDEYQQRRTHSGCRHHPCNRIVADFTLFGSVDQTYSDGLPGRRVDYRFV